MFVFTTIFGYIVAIIMMILILISILIQNLFNNQQLLEPVIKLFCRIIPAAFGIRIKVSGKEHLGLPRNSLFIVNHVNLLDPVIVYGFIPRFVRGVELEDHFKLPLYGSIIRRLGNVPISHKDPKSALESLNVAAEVIKKGTSIVMFPEGHRTRTGELQTFMSGPFRLARNAGVDIVPVALKGLWERKSVHSPFIKPGRVEFIFGDTITVETIAEKSDRTLRKEAKEQIGHMLDLPLR